MLLILSAYLLGSIPFGVLVGRHTGIDPRQGGSRNIGATNVARLMGWKWGLLVLALDIGKGISAVCLVQTDNVNLMSMAAFAAALGHCYSIFLRGKGGKGVATALGVMCMIDLTAAALATFVWVALSVFFRIAALSSLFATATMVLVVQLNQESFEVRILAVSLFCLITIRHTANLKQLKRRWFGKGV